MRRYLGQLVLLTALLAGATVPAQAVTPTGGINQCLVLAVCVEISTPGSSGSPGGGTTGGTGGGGGETLCNWKTIKEPCWDPDLGWFDSTPTDATYGCYLKLADPSDPAWSQTPPDAQAEPYVTTCLDANGNIIGVSITWSDKPPMVGAPPPTPGTVAQMAIAQLQFMRPAIHVAPNGKSLVGVPVFLWYDHGTTAAPDPETIGPQSQNVQLNGTSVTATATLTDVRWDIGYQVGGKEAVADCHGAGVPYTAGMEDNPPAGSCYWKFSSYSPTGGGPPTYAPSPTASASPGGGYWPVATEVWTVNCYDENNGGALIPAWSGLVLDVASLPVQLQVNQIQVLN